jgi:transposase
MRFVPLKSLEQQSRLCVHRARQGYVQPRTALINRIRGLLSELGIVLPLKAATLRREAHQHLEDLPGWCNTVVGDMLSKLSYLDTRIKEYDQHIEQAAKEDVQGRQLMRLCGVGPVTASAIVASVASVAKAKTSAADASSAVGWVWRTGNAARAASSGWGASPRPGMRTCERC